MTKAKGLFAVSSIAVYIFILERFQNAAIFSLLKEIFCEKEVEFAKLRSCELRLEFQDEYVHFEFL